ncbi:MAG: hypothetical protein FJ009_07785 [Chloroflexi bacterium]|nr:hypothetical protein [Chloroflexota bacterium]
MRQLLVECSDPGIIVSLAEEFENILRQVNFARAEKLQYELRDLARELGTEFEQAWRGFRIEVPNDSGRPLSFGNREMVDEARVQQLLTHAAERGIGKFEMRDTLLLPQDGPAPETRGQYVRDLADSIRYEYLDDLHLLSRPTDLPDAMAAHRQNLMDEHVADVLRARARDANVGHRWIQTSVGQLQKALEEVDTRAEAVMLYELTRLNPAEVEPEERTRWAMLAARLGKEVEKWLDAAEEPLTFLYQRFALACLAWNECQGMGPARPILEKRLRALIEQAKEIYTADAVDALKLAFKDLHQSPLDRLRDISEMDKPDAETDE